MNTIITRGYVNNLIIVRGYTSFLQKIKREVVRLVSAFTKLIKMDSQLG